VVSQLPRRDVVDLWTIDLVGDAPTLARAGATLHERERARAERIARPLARDRFILARAALRTILGGYLGVGAADVPLREEPAGKPHLPSPEGPAFSLSHTGDLAAVAVASRARVGIDVERLARPPVAPAVLRRVLDEHELALVLAVPEAQRDEAFLRHWTAKEAYVKALGTGLATGLRAVGIRDALTAPALAHGVAVGEAWSLRRFDPGPGFVGTVAVAGGTWTARRRNLTPSAVRSL
jgi:4'-phosphopantetheinyl transferase